MAYRLGMHLTFLPLDTGSTWPFTRPSYHTPGRTDCTIRNLRQNREVSDAHSSNACRETNVAHACNDRAKYCACVWRCTIPYLLFIYVLTTSAVCNISCIASNINCIGKILMKIWRCLIYHLFIQPVIFVLISTLDILDAKPHFRNIPPWCCSYSTSIRYFCNHQ